jgi:hypothetical protein
MILKGLTVFPFWMSSTRRRGDGLLFKSAQLADESVCKWLLCETSDANGPSWEMHAQLDAEGASERYKRRVARTYGAFYVISEG